LGQTSGEIRRENAKLWLDVIARSDLSAVAQRAKAKATKQSIFPFAAQWIASLALAMTVTIEIALAV